MRLYCRTMHRRQTDGSFQNPFCFWFCAFKGPQNRSVSKKSDIYVLTSHNFFLYYTRCCKLCSTLHTVYAHKKVYSFLGQLSKPSDGLWLWESVFILRPAVHPIRRSMAMSNCFYFETNRPNPQTIYDYEKVYLF